MRRILCCLIVALLLIPACKRLQPSPPDSRAASPARSPAPDLELIPLEDRQTPPPHRPNTLLGGELGLDHVGIAVRDLEAARSSYRKLGFGSPSPGKLPNGIQNINYYFKDTTYLETMSAWDEKKVPWLASFTRKHEGTYFVALCIYSAEETAAFLEGRGFPTFPPRPGSIAVPGSSSPPGEMWKTLFFKKSPLPEGSFFFIAYDRKVRQNLFDRLNTRHLRRRLFTHPNTAQGIRAVWYAVKNAAATVRVLTSMGLTAGPAVEHAALGARGQRVAAGIGELIVLEPADPKGKLAAFLKTRGEGLIGLTITVRHLQMARMRIERNTGVAQQPVPGFYGTGLLLPPELTHGAWMEMAPWEPAR